MKRMLILLLALAPWVATPALAEIDGLVKKSSPYSVGQTLDRLQARLEAKGITIAMRWEHGDRAKAVGIPLRDTEVMIFGNPKLGSHLMTSAQSAGIDLPMKALAWRDEQGQVWLAYNDPLYIAARHGITERDEVLQKMSTALDKLTSAAVASD